MPLHALSDLQGCEQRPVAALQGLSVTVGTNEFRYDVREARLPGSDLWVQLVDCPAVFDRPFIYSDAHDEHVRYLMLTRAALECCQRLGFAPDIVHCNDWHTAFAPLLLRTAYAWDTQIFGATRSVFTIHNIGYQGVFSASAAADVGPGVSIEALHQADLGHGRINPMRHGILYADAVTTVSPTYAQEIRTPEGGYGLDADLRARRDSVSGILNGVDYDDWNPATDRYLPFHYDASDLTGKARNKEALLDLLRMPAPASVPLIGMVTRLTRQKGIDLLAETLPELLQERDFRFVALGSGEAQYERFMHELQEQLPRARRVLQRLQRGTRALHRSRGGHLPDAVAVRAVRPQPDVQPQVRHGAGRAPHRRTRRQRAAFRSRDRPGHGHRVQRFRRGRPALGAADGARVVRLAERVAPARAERHAAGFFVGRARRRVRGALRAA